MYFFFFNDTATTEIYTLSLHDALPIYQHHQGHAGDGEAGAVVVAQVDDRRQDEQRHQVHHLDERVERRADRKSTRLNSSHANISYAVFCLKKKKKHWVQTCESNGIAVL